MSPCDARWATPKGLEPCRLDYCHAGPHDFGAFTSFTANPETLPAQGNGHDGDHVFAIPGAPGVPPPSLGDAVSKPLHYNQGGVECIAAIEAAVVGLPPFDAYLVGNAIKYTWRHSKKNGNEDLFKAIWHLQRLAEDRLKRGAK